MSLIWFVKGLIVDAKGLSVNWAAATANKILLTKRRKIPEQKNVARSRYISKQGMGDLMDFIESGDVVDKSAKGRQGVGQEVRIWLCPLEIPLSKFLRVEDIHSFMG